MASCPKRAPVGAPEGLDEGRREGVLDGVIPVPPLEERHTAGHIGVPGADPVCGWGEGARASQSNSDSTLFCKFLFW